MPDLSVKITGRILKAPDGHLGVLPLELARNAHGNIADRVRDIGEVRGTDTNRSPRTQLAGTGGATATKTKPAAMVAKAAGHPASALPSSNACVAWRGLRSQVVDPSFQSVARVYSGKPDALEYLSHKIRQARQGVWGTVPMPCAGASQ